MTRSRPWRLAAPALALAIVLLSAGLRSYRLDFQSYWHDEGNSLYLAGESVPIILQSAAADIHPPAYYLALKFWRAGLGETEFALRSLSALAGVVLVALVYRLGRLFFDTPAALAAAALAAFNPFLIYYAQEARMYALAATLGAASFALFVMWLNPSWASRSAHQPAWLVAAAYVVGSAWGLYTHYAFAFIIVAQNALMAAYLAAALWGARRSGRRPGLRPFAVWLAMQAVTLLLYLPWLPIAYRQLTGWPAAREFHSFFPALADAARYLVFGRTVETGVVLPALGLAGLALLIGIFGGGARRALVPAFWLLIPAGLTLAFGLLSEAFSKFLLVAVPPLCLLLGRAIGGLGYLPRPQPGQFPVLRRAASLLLTAGALVLAAPSLQNLYFNPAYFRDDYRGIARYVESVQRPGDAILLIAPNQVQAFGYYHRSGAEVFPLPHSRPLDPAETTRSLEAIVAQHSRLFVLFWAEQQADPEHFVESWLNTQAFKAGDVWYGQVRLATYAVSTPAAEMAVPIGAQFVVNPQAHITLAGYTLQAEAFSPGDILQLTLFWQTDAPLTERYKVFVHVYADPTQPPPAQQDGEPGGGLLITPQWVPGQRYADNHGVALPADLPPGRYTLAVGLYNLFGGTRLPMAQGGERLEIGTITVK
jgi:hypothetical protein